MLSFQNPMLSKISQRLNERSPYVHDENTLRLPNLGSNSRILRSLPMVNSDYHTEQMPMVKEPPGIIQAKLNSKYHERSDLRHINTLFLNPKIN